MQLRSERPRVRLVKAFDDPFDNAVATARTCYSSRVITDDDVKQNPALRDKIAESTYKAGHHTTLQHAHFEFVLDGVSRQALWSFFHAHPFYNSEQVSQRYVEVKAGRVLLPALGDDELDRRFDACVQRQMRVYHELIELLAAPVARLYFGLFPARRRDVVDKRWSSAMQKRAQEVARYVLPIGTHAHLYHTISALTLHRYHRVCQSHDCPSEQRLIVDEMVRLVAERDANFAKFMEAELPLSSSLDDQLARRFGRTEVDGARASAFVREFDGALEGKLARLVGFDPRSLRLLAGALRETLGLLPQDLDDDAALRALLDPKENPSLGESLALLTLQKGARALELVQLTFQKKLSHTADSQAQRHRMTPGVRPVLWTHVDPGTPDYVLPRIFEEPDAAAAREVYEREMRAVFDDIAVLHARNVPAEAWQYLLPNAFPVRFTETGSLLDQHHKWTTRLCFNAQEEIWRSAKEEVDQIADAAPALAALLLPPCGLRKRADVQPYCPEGDRFCGQPVWSKARGDYLRVL